MDDLHFLDIRNAAKRFRTPEGGTVTALDNLSLGVRSNEFITLLGPSGCGKTTLLRAVSGFEDLDSGLIAIDGHNVERMPAHRRPVNTVFQSYALFPHMNVADNVGYSLTVARVEKREKNARIGQALEMVGLSGMERRMPRQLSGGQQQRVALARAIINRPKLLLLDEPLSALDRNLRQSMQLELKNLQHELGISFVFVTHDQGEALTMSDRIVVLNDGRIQQMGTPTEIYDHPSCAFVAGFIGESNLFEATVAEQEGDITVLKDDDGVELRTRGAGLAAGTRATVLIRPEKFSLLTGACDAPLDGSVIRAKVDQTVFVGTDFQILAETERGKALKAVIRDGDRSRVSALTPGSQVNFWYSHASPHLIPGGVAPPRAAA
jgi:spermidine/putrescine transport system ATP-binding protein